MMLWELATHEIPYGDTNSDLIRSLVKEGQREEFPDKNKVPLEYQQLTEHCWAQKPDERPTVENIQECLSKMKFVNYKPQTLELPSNGSIGNNSGYALQSNVQPQSNNGYFLKSEIATPKSQNPSQVYALQSNFQPLQSSNGYVLNSNYPNVSQKQSTNNPFQQVQPSSSSYILKTEAVNQAPLSSQSTEQAEALCDCIGQGSSDLSFKKGDKINISEKIGNWWMGELNGKTGYIPSK